MSIRSNSPVHAIPSLDGLRAVSILMVLLSHSALTQGFPSLLAQQMNFPFGTVGVRIFFVISGFLITTLLVREERSRGVISLSAFYKRRLLRILPAYYFYILTVFVIGHFVTSMKCPLSTYLSAATFTTRLWGYWGGAHGFDQTWCLIHTWSLSVEEQFYILWPSLLIFIPSGTGRRRLVVLLIIGLVPVVRMLFIHFGLNQKILGDQLFVTQADSLMFGCLLALALERYESVLSSIFCFHPQLIRMVATIAIFAPSLGASYLMNSTIYFHQSIAAFVPSIQAFAIAYLIGSYILIKKGITYRILNLPALQWLGILSYSLYLWQQLYLTARGAYSTIHWCQIFPQNLGFVLVSALFSYYIVEKPFLSLKSRFSRVKTTSLDAPTSSVGDEGKH